MQSITGVCLHLAPVRRWSQDGALTKVSDPHRVQVPVQYEPRRSCLVPHGLATISRIKSVSIGSMLVVVEIEFVAASSAVRTTW